MLAGVVRATPSRVVAVVRGNDNKVARLESRGDLRHPPVKRFERCGVARNVPAVTELGVEIDEVGEGETAVGQFSEGVDGGGETGIVAMWLHFLAGAAMGKDVADLADRDHGASGLGQDIENGVRRGLCREVLA